MASDKVQHNPTYAPNEKKRNRIKQDSQVAKEKHAKHVCKQRFLGGWGLVHDDTISWISPVLKYEHKYEPKRGKKQFIQQE